MTIWAVKGFPTKLMACAVIEIAAPSEASAIEEVRRICDAKGTAAPDLTASRITKEFGRKDAATKHRAFDLSIKAVGADGKFSGYGSVWGVTDSYREQVAPGAFAQSLAETKAKGRTLPILWQHRSDEPIGQWDVLSEDDHGLYGEGTLWTDEAPYARIAHRGMKANAISGLSIGYYVREDSFDEKTRLRTLKRLDLIEVSVVTNPANDEARVDSIKAKLAAGELISEREFGKILREKGFSRSDAALIAEGGFKAWASGDGQPHQATAGSLGDLAQALSSLSLPKI